MANVREQVTSGVQDGFSETLKADRYEKKEEFYRQELKKHGQEIGRCFTLCWLMFFFVFHHGAFDA